MFWTRDRTGRFPRRPYYTTSELEVECESLLAGFLQSRHDGAFNPPITTDDLSVLIEHAVDDLDLFADLSSEGADVEGVTDFFPNARPRVRIARTLSTDPRMRNRLRTTLTHELGHVLFHQQMFAGPTTGFLFELEQTPPHSNRCKRDRIVDAPETDWMEWQAGFACGALLMPKTILQNVVGHFKEEHGIPAGRLCAGAQGAVALIATVADAFEVSREAARVRLLQRQILVESTHPDSLFK